MSPLKKKATIILKTRQQKDAYIERLDQAHVDYDVTVKRGRYLYPGCLLYHHAEGFRPEESQLSGSPG